MGEVINTVGVLGTGVIGASWATLFLAKGLKVILSDPASGSKESFERYLDAAWIALEKAGMSDMGRKNKNNYEVVDSLLDHIGDIDFVQENSPERQDLKTKLIAELDAHARPGIIIASSSSGMPASSFISQCKNAPQRILVAHPFNPPHLVPLVEVVPHPGTDERTVNNALEFYRNLGKRPILINHEIPGFVANRLQAVVNNEAYSLVSRGIVSAEDLDAAMATGPGLRWAVHGPLVTNTLGGGGGKDGFWQRLERLGPGIRVWERDILAHRFCWTESEQRALKDKVEEYLDHIDLSEVSTQRDQALLEMLCARRKSDCHV
ncbi:hypothetical protein LTR84_004725 [Exophiala bonariae]|uniref:3-hydroxyacyl-CoA dehydrogenase n=1 Tax=Exophiala bonariae TaxID=1690606 RepID=A0AAV9NRL1_9EURO|nr:hypothetical protein LTR84_004725 [Exophiala bonariae]